jgi:hypothetical protein
MRRGSVWVAIVLVLGVEADIEKVVGSDSILPARGDAHVGFLRRKGPYSQTT